MEKQTRAGFALPEALAGAERCLDRQLAERLTEYFRLPFESLAGGLEGALQQWRWRRLTASLRLAATESAHYRKRFESAGAETLIREAEGEAELSPGGGAATLPEPARCARAVRALLRRLPPTLPESLAAAPESFLAVGQSEIEGVISLPTSGTTGPGKRIFCTEDDLADTAAFFHYGMQYMLSPERGDSVALLMSGERPGSVGDLLGRGMAALGVACAVPGFVPPGPEGEEAMLDRLERLRPSCLVGVPAQIVSLARHPRAGRIAPFLRSVLLSGDAVAASMRAGIAAGFGCEVFVHYGLTETGLGGAVECRQHDGCHIREADMIVEITDETGRPLPDGSTGEIVITTLTRRAMPLLRYRTGDEGRILPGRCACGSVFTRLLPLGRMNRRLSLPDGSILRLSDIDSLLYALPFIRSYTATLHQAEGEPPCLALCLRTAANAPADGLGQAGAALARLPGLRLVPGPTDSRAEEARLPLVLRQAHEGEPGSAGQAKQIFHHSTKPVFS